MLHNLLKRTPLISLQAVGRPDIFLKAENLQFSGSFKSRGVISYLSQFASTPKGLVTFTTGNQGLAVAALADKLGIPSIIVTSIDISDFKKERLLKYGAKIHFTECKDLQKSVVMAKIIAMEKDYLYIPIYGENTLLLGYGKIVEEINEELPGKLNVFIPIGTGTLLHGIAQQLKQLNQNNNIIAVEPFGHQRITGKQVGSPGIADSLSIETIPECNQFSLNNISQHFAIKDIAIVNAMNLLKKELNLVAEPGSAIALAAALTTKKNDEKKIVILTGGNIASKSINRFTNEYAY